MNLSVFLPKTSLPMKGRLAEQEPIWLQRWKSIQLYKQWRKKRQGAPLFVMHDGPPYANGPIHLGHGLNKILKDFTVRCRFMAGYDVSFVPGWDCHGLPIETQIEKDYLQKKVQRQQVQVSDFRSDCRDFAQKWIDVQKTGFQRLGVMADWENPYTTMDPVFESRILHHFYRMVSKGYIYRGLRPVLWSPAEQTALAESEVEYQDITSPSIYVRFSLKHSSLGWDDASIVIWTTTPWSLPGNRGITYAPEAQYGCYQVRAVTSDSLAIVGEKIIVAVDLWEQLCTACGISDGVMMASCVGSDLAGSVAKHPWNNLGYDHDVPLLESEYVTTDTGTGLVHTAPGHGIEDFDIGKRHGLEVASPLSERGIFKAEYPVVAGLEMRSAYPVIRTALIEQEALMAESAYTHSYPHSWRSKKPLFYRATSQWFITLDGPLALRQKALNALPGVQWYPAEAETRMKSMLSSRPDWCISRQRVWGVPIAMFIHAESGEILADDRVFQRITDRVATEGVDFWFTDEAHSVLDGLYDPQEWIKNQDIIDVWFESGVTHEVVLKDGVPESRTGSIAWPASVYFEGSDQHRAWFQSSLATAIALEDQAPYRAVVTHGFCLDQQGRKMSKSLGNVTDPQDVVDQHGADILRLWVGYEDYQKDVRMGPVILDRVTDIYRRLRNTLRFSLGALHGFSQKEMVPVSSMGILERMIHHRLYVLDQQIHESMEQYDFQAIVQMIYDFCNQDLSAFYFDISKDSLYCDDENSPLRQQIRTTLWHVLIHVVHWLAPFIPFTAEESWTYLAKDVLGIDPAASSNDWSASNGLLDVLRGMGLVDDVWSIHLNQMPRAPESWHDPVAADMVERLRTVRSAVTTVLERVREDKKIGSNLQTAPVVVLGPQWHDVQTDHFAMWCVTSHIHVERVEGAFSMENPGQWMPEEGYVVVGDDMAIKVVLADGDKCHRCWRYLPCVKTRNAEIHESVDGAADQAPDVGVCDRCWSVASCKA